MAAILDQVSRPQFAQRELERLREPSFLAALRETQSAAERLAAHSTFLRLLGDVNDFANRVRASRPILEQVQASRPILDLVQASSVSASAPAPVREEAEPDESVGEHVGSAVTSFDQALYLIKKGLL